MTSSQILNRHPAFAYLPPAALAQLVSRSEERQLKKGDILFREGDEARSLFLVIEGRLQLFHYTLRGKEESNCMACKADLFCCLPTLDHKPFPATAMAQENSVVCEIPLAELDRIHEQYPDAYRDLVRYFSGRLRELECSMSYQGEKTDVRLAQTLLRLQEKYGARIPLTRREIAELAHTTVETALRVTNRMKRFGWLSTGRGWIEVHSPQELKSLL